MTTGSAKQRLDRAFQELRVSHRFIAEADWQCCNTCGVAALPAGTEDFVFYHRQALDNLVDTGGCYLNWGGRLETIRTALERQGLFVGHDGSEAKKIFVTLQDSKAYREYMASQEAIALTKGKTDG